MAPYFISYRRSDTRWQAGRLADGLKARYGSKNVFLDVSGAVLGADYVERIERELSTARRVLVLIGPRPTPAGGAGWTTKTTSSAARSRSRSHFPRPWCCPC